ncbi:MAG: gliding motility-associated C-terminal domain-containing protein [Bacteroidota bacterium]
MKVILPPLLMLVVVWSVQLQAQPTYTMSTQTVDDCEGILLDSENGDVGGTYDHNENYSFSICIPGADRINLEFQQFCTEEDFDYLRIFDGPDTLSPQIGGVYTGEDDPPMVVVTSGCLTVNFISDVSVTCTGWYARWWIEFEEPVPPDILPISNLSCGSHTLSFTFGEPLPCDSLYLAAFSVLGPQVPEIISVDPGACSGGVSTSVTLTFADPLTIGGDYRVRYQLYRPNSCDILRELFSTEPFGIYDCPLNVVLEIPDEPLCAGDCIRISAIADGGDPNTYSYSWSPSLPDSASLQICPDSFTNYSVTVSDGFGATASASIDVDPAPLPTINSDDLSICQSDAPFELTATPPGGAWSGAGISEAVASTGLYDPSLVDATADTVYYTDPTTGCASSIAVEINELDVGTDDAACPNTAAFYVSGGTPDGGSWSGMHIQPDGLFDPIAIGSFPVTYTHPNGCSGTKMVNVGAIQLPLIDTLCQSDTPFELAVTPFGGQWVGPGIEDEDTGLFNPQLAGAGEVELIYQISGCSDTLRFFIKGINAGEDLSACPAQPSFILPGDWSPAGGLWSGLGIIDQISGRYDPTLLPDGTNDTLLYTANGCAAQRIVYIRQTRIDYTDTFLLCDNEGPLELSMALFGIIPEGGTWTGPGLSGEAGIWPDLFDPLAAGRGTHLLIYTANTCIDSLYIRVLAAPVLRPALFCIEDAPAQLASNLAGGRWRGPGIVNRQAGIFDPRRAGVGVHQITQESPEGCSSTVEVTVVPPPDPGLDSLPDFYCFKDTLLLSVTDPQINSLLVDGVAYQDFNPAEIGPGDHTLEFTAGIGECLTEGSLRFTVGLPIAVQLPFYQDSICYGTSIQLIAEGSGGLPGASYTYSWDQGLGFGSNHLVAPTVTTHYTVHVTDGCSDPASATLFVFVHPEIQSISSTGPRVCFDDTTFATIQALPLGHQYQYVWDTDPPTYGPRVESYPTDYEVQITDTLTGCTTTAEVELPGYAPIQANFGINPNEECISSLDPTIQLLDFSVGGVRGHWNFGDSSFNEPYIFGQELSHEFPDTGSYLIQLYIENEGECSSVFSREVCIRAEHRLFAPNAFTPNYDGRNDVFHFKGVGIASLSWQVFNRWGQQLFVANGMEAAWDGQFKGRMVEPGVYTYVARYTTEHNSRPQVLKGFVTVVY